MCYLEKVHDDNSEKWSMKSSFMVHYLDSFIISRS